MRKLFPVSCFLLLYSFAFLSFTGAQPSDAAIDNAVSWAQSLVGEASFPWAEGSGRSPSTFQCSTFVANAYGRQGTTSAYILWFISEQHPGDLSAPRGSLLFFGRNTDNRGLGHVALCAGEGRLIEAGWPLIKTGTIDEESDYLGWAWPPPDWPGRDPSGP